MLELADLVRRHAPAYLARFGALVPQPHRRALQAIARCRTPENGGSIYRCTTCAAGHFGFHSCHHRACPKCGAPEAKAWEERQRERLLPVPYFLVTFTIPAELRATFRSNQRLCYRLLFAASAGALQDVAAVPRHLGAQLGFTGVLHTWSRMLTYHPHVHYVIPGGGLRADQKKWRKCRTTKQGEPYLLCVEVLSERFRQRLKESLQAEDPALFYALPGSLWERPWVVHAKAAGSGHAVLGYLSRYVFRTALSNARLLADDGTHITFAYTESETGLHKTCSLNSDEFLRRFLQHVLPTGFQRVRHFGFCHPRAQLRFLRVQTLLSVPLLLLPAGRPSRPCTCAARPVRASPSKSSAAFRGPRPDASMAHPLSTTGLHAGNPLVRTRTRAPSGALSTQPTARKSTRKRSQTALKAAKPTLFPTFRRRHRRPGPEVSLAPRLCGHRLPLSRKMQSA